MDDLAMLGGLFAIAFLAATLIPAQSETALVGLQLAGYSPAMLVVVAGVGNVLGAMLNWLLGRGIERFHHSWWFPIGPPALNRATPLVQSLGTLELAPELGAVCRRRTNCHRRRPPRAAVELCPLGRHRQDRPLCAAGRGDRGFRRMIGLFQDLVALQREIYFAFADRIKMFAAGGDWGRVPCLSADGRLVGAIHALTPGHSKAVLAAYLAGAEEAGAKRGLLTSFILAFTHVGMAVLIALLALPLVSVTLGSVGRAPLLETFSRGLLGVVVVDDLALNRSRSPPSFRRGKCVVRYSCSLIPCPLTLFVMTFAIVRGVPSAGLAFAGTMLIGVAIVMAIVALAAVLFRIPAS